MPTLPKDISYQKLYKPDQNIWFLNWILKQHGCYPYLNQIILSIPFTVKRYYRTNGILSEFKIFKHDQRHGLFRAFYDDDQIWYEEYWKNGKLHGLNRAWYLNGQISSEKNWQNGRRHGLSRHYNENGQIRWEDFV